MNAHQKRVAEIVAQVRQAAKRSQLIKVYHGSSNSTRIPDFSGRQLVDTSALRHVIEVNVKEKYVSVEPSVQMDELVRATLQYGLVPPVIMEFPGISVGGGVQGGAAESSSFRYGGFHETALEYEMVLGDGNLAYASRKKNADLFWGTACSYGSLGIITLVKLRLIPAAPFVKLTYQKTTSHMQALQCIDKEIHNATIDFMDGILFTPDSGVIMTGKFADKPEGPTATFTSKGDDWFYLHAQKIVSKHTTYEEYIPLQDYLFRYDRGAFWVGRLAFAHLRIPFNKLTRRLLDGAMHTRFLFRVVHETDLSQRFFVQDIFMPKENVGIFIDYISPKLQIWPLWLLPMRASREKLDNFGLSYSKSAYMVNVGIWGKAPTESFEAFVALNREVEEKLPQLQARKTFYAHSYYPRDRFWQVYDRQHYNALREKYHTEGVFEDIYDKVTVVKKYQAPVGRAVWRHLMHRALLLLQGKRQG